VLTAVACPRAPKPPRLEQLVYQVESPSPVFAAAAAAAFLDTREFLMVRRRPKGERTVDVRRLVAALEVPDDRHVTLRLQQADKDNLKVAEVLAGIFSLTEAQTRDLQMVKIQVKEADPGGP
jgi:hypothetical protein